MDHGTLSWILSLWAQLMMFAAAAASPSSQSSVNCSVSQRHDASIRYRLSRAPTSGKCETCWEDENKTVLARDSDSAPDRVQTLTNDSIVLKLCLDYLRYTWECDGVAEETFCIVNCSIFTTNNTRPSSWFCFSDSVCLSALGGGLLIGSIVAAVILVIIIWLIVLKRKRTSLYEPPKDLELTSHSAEGGRKRNEVV